MKTSKELKSTSLACNFCIKASMRTCKSQVDYMEEVKQIKEKQEEMWNNNNRNTSAREAYTCWAHQQANLNLSEIPITQISDLMQTNAEKGRPMFYGCLKSDYGASSSSQADPQESVPLQTAPPILGFQPPHPPPN
ncbi:hypothetical protein PIB30_063134 [Stylosanthes scabra]|uniref:Uncharacterized protein n=1 Tax=Stylosanthes scabra TaxID=79078 RepID=A0ABU6QN94_9FABA|nr:hypothetical protein [Stylosanthes scabra]